MKTIVKTNLPTCDLCGAEEANHNSPTVYGPWANMCEACFPDNVCPRRGEAGYLYITTPTPETDRQEQIALAIENGDMDLVAELVGDGDLLEYL